MSALDTGKAPVRICAALPDEVVARAALAACHAQSLVARETLGRAGPACRAPCPGCLAAARAVAEVMMEAGLQPVELVAPAIVLGDGG